MIDAKNVTITDSEWEVMRAIWTMGSTSSRELIDAMNELQGWSDSNLTGITRPRFCIISTFYVRKCQGAISRHGVRSIERD